MSEIRLKPCPFCGGRAKYMEIKDFFVSRFVTCAKCGIETPRNCLNRKDAIKQWNRRTPMDNIMEKLEELKKPPFIDTPYHTGFICGVNYSINIVKQEINNGLE